MLLLVLGGTRFLSREVATQAVARGWDVTCACRGESGPAPDGAAHLRWDRAEEAPAALADGRWDAVVDVARLPSQVRRAVAATADAHWVFVSTISVYPDNSSSAMEPLAEPITSDVDLATDPEAYDGMKVACEQIVRTEDGLVTGRPPRPHRRAGGPDRSLRPLAATVGARRPGAGGLARPLSRVGASVDTEPAAHSIRRGARCPGPGGCRRRRRGSVSPSRRRCVGDRRRAPAWSRRGRRSRRPRRPRAAC